MTHGGPARTAMAVAVAAAAAAAAADAAASIRGRRRDATATARNSEVLFKKSAVFDIFDHFGLF